MPEMLPDSLVDMQRIVGDWQDRTFPEATIYSASRHLRAEVVELIEAINIDGEHIVEEIADVQLLLIAVANKAGVDIAGATAVKFAVNQARRWGKPNAEGYTEHVRDDA